MPDTLIWKIRINKPLNAIFLQNQPKFYFYHKEIYSLGFSEYAPSLIFHIVFNTGRFHMAIPVSYQSKYNAIMKQRRYNHSEL